MRTPGAAQAPGATRIHFVDLANWRSLGVARVGRHDWLMVGWVSGGRVVAVSGEGPGRQRLLWVDARSKKVVARRAFAGWIVNTLPVPGGLAVVLGPREGVGPIRILVLDASGGTRTSGSTASRRAQSTPRGGRC